jgi:hypothetical protein
MAYADELLELAQDIANLHPQQPHQSSLRRAVSTAYYALFHLLISEATVNWARPEFRGALARVFDHGPMKQAADKKVSELNSYFKEKPPDGQERVIAYHLYNVADVFAQAQYHRNEADYNTARLAVDRGSAAHRRHCRCLQELEHRPRRTGRSSLPCLDAPEQGTSAEREADS